MKITLLLFFALLLILAAYLYGAYRHRTDYSSVPGFDLNRYLGSWYEIARFDNSFEHGLDNVTAHYALRPDGKVEVINRGTDLSTGEHSEAHGKAKTTRAPGRLRVSFFWIFYSDYNVLELAPDYSWSLVGSRSPRYLWILSRTKDLPAATLEQILTAARNRGYDTDKLRYTDQQ